MTGVVPANPKVQFCDALGVPLAVGTVDVYLAGTMTRTTTWQDKLQASANTNPILLDSRGECVIWVDATKTYKYVLKNVAGVEQYTVDNIPGLADITAAAAAVASALDPYIAAAEAAQAAAEDAEDGAVAAETAASAYAALAATGAKFYDTIALGRAAVADTFTFGVKAGGSDNLLRPTVYRRDSAGTQTLLFAVIPGSEFDAKVSETISNGFAVSDTDGNLVVRVDTASSLNVDSGGLETDAVAVMATSLKYKIGVSDGDGNLAFAVDYDSKILGDVSLTTGRSAFQSTGTYDYDINHVIGYGQSLALGQATPAISTVQHYDNLMFVDGMRPAFDYTGHSDAVRYATFVAAVEALSPADATVAETPMSALGDMVKERMLLEDGLSYSAQNYQLLLSVAAQGATAISGLAQGTTPYTRMVTQATYGAANAATLNKTMAVQAVTMVHGESDYPSTTQAAYYASENTLVTNLNTDIKAVTGQTKSIVFITNQIASHKVGGATTPTIALAQLQAEGSNALIYIACPMYQFEYQSIGNFHITAADSRWLGAYLGLAYKRIVIDGLAWGPVQPVSSIKTGKIALVTFHVPVGPLVLDTTNVALNTNYGFELVDSGGSSLTISSVGLRGSNTVKIIAASSIPAGAKLRYAWTGAQNVGKDFGPRGNLRDSQGDTLSFDPHGLNKPMHNWCVIFEWSL